MAMNRYWNDNLRVGYICKTYLQPVGAAAHRPADLPCRPWVPKHPGDLPVGDDFTVRNLRYDLVNVFKKVFFITKSLKNELFRDEMREVALRFCAARELFPEDIETINARLLSDCPQKRLVPENGDFRLIDIPQSGSAD